MDRNGYIKIKNKGKITGPRDYRIRVQQRTLKSTALRKKTQCRSEEIRPVELIRHIDSKSTIPFYRTSSFQPATNAGCPIHRVLCDEWDIRADARTAFISYHPKFVISTEGEAEVEKPAFLSSTTANIPPQRSSAAVYMSILPKQTKRRSYSVYLPDTHSTASPHHREP